MPDSPVITLTTDFGYTDPFVGVMKGVILRINPQAVIIDLTHGIRPHDIQEAMYVIGMNYDYFPKNTIHAVVVDPGVGSGRRPVLIQTDNHYFIGPDNGVFTQIYDKSGDDLQVFHITAEHYFLATGSPTFQGRDVFAPVAGWLSAGVDATNFGERIADYHTIRIPAVKMADDNSLSGEVITIDQFGNAMTNITAPDIERLSSKKPGHPLKVVFHGKEVPIKNFYAQAADGGVSALLNSSGCLEIFVYQGKAASRHNITVGDTVQVVLT